MVDVITDFMDALIWSVGAREIYDTGKSAD